MGTFQPIEGLNRKKGRGRLNSLSFSLCLPDFPSAPWTGSDSTGFLGSLAYIQQTLRLLTLHNHATQLFLINLIHIDTCISCWFCSLESPDSWKQEGLHYKYWLDPTSVGKKISFSEMRSATGLDLQIFEGVEVEGSKAICSLVFCHF